jgi:protein TonB
MRLSATVGLVVILSAVVASAQSEKRVYVLILGSRGISPPVVVKQVRPTYTREARAAHVQGMMRLDVTVRPNGRADEVTISESELWRYVGRAAKSGPPALLTADEIAKLGLDRAAMNAIKKWIWKPATKDATPVAVRIVVPLTFALGN